MGFRGNFEGCRGARGLDKFLIDCQLNICARSYSLYSISLEVGGILQCSTIKTIDVYENFENIAKLNQFQSCVKDNVIGVQLMERIK